jgi:hypothetical protein
MAILINEKEKVLIDSNTGDIVRPTCWENLHPYYLYLKHGTAPGKAQSLLDDVFRGELVITKMIEHHQKTGNNL